MIRGGIRVKKKEVEEFIEECQKDGCAAKKAVQNLNKVQIAELKAELKVKSIHKDKIIVILIPYLTVALTVLPLILDMEGANKNIIALFGFGIYVAIAFLMIRYMWHKSTKEAALERAISFLEDFSG